jgi:Cu(I)/Ag(I) efflux system membrane fusion protein
MEAQARSSRRLVSRLVLLAVGIAVGAGFATAHFTGRLTPFYHKLGFHSFHSGFDQLEGGETTPSGVHAGHAGHGGLSTEQLQGAPAKLPGYSVVTITPERQQLIGVRKGKVERGRLLMDIRAVGIIEPDQTRLDRIHTRTSGWVTKVHVNYIGQNVKKGDPLLEIYSPDLLVTQQDYLRALKGARRRDADEFQGNLLAAARRRLELLGVAPEEIRELTRTQKARETLRLRARLSGRVLDRRVLEGSYVEPAMELYQIADLSTVWLQAKVYEYELPHIELNQPVQVSLLSQPGKTFPGKVSFVEPVLQEMTRTVKVRVAIANPKDLFKPGMYADLKISHDMGTGLLVPESALLRTGERAVAFRSLPGGRFEPVEVIPGARFGERYQVLAGLAEGDTIVTSAVFLIDAESRLKSAVSMPGGHQHGSGGSKPGPAPAAPRDPGDGKSTKEDGNGDHHHHH